MGSSNSLFFRKKIKTICASSATRLKWICSFIFRSCRIIFFQLFPIFDTWKTNSEITRQHNKIKWNDLYNNHVHQLKTAQKVDFEKMADDLYSFEIQRKETIESKASALFDAIGFALTILSVSGIIFSKNNIAQWILLMLPLLFLILAGICSWKALNIKAFYLINRNTLDMIIKQNPSKKQGNRIYAIEKSMCAEMNQPLLLKKSNWVSAAQQQFIIGLLFVVVFIGAT